MDSTQLATVLEQHYPTIGKSYAIQNGVLVFALWLDRATGQPSTTPQPTLAQCETWASSLPSEPDWDGFARHCLTVVMANDYTLINPLLAQYPCFEIGIRTKNASMLRAEIARAATNAAITPAMETALLDAAATYHIPMGA